MSEIDWIDAEGEKTIVYWDSFWTELLDEDEQKELIRYYTCIDTAGSAGGYDGGYDDGYDGGFDPPAVPVGPVTGGDNLSRNYGSC